jgi:hypothetical protein
VAAGHASPSGKERKRLPTTRDPRGSIEAMSTVANGHPPTDRTRAGRRKGDRAWGDVGSRPERRPLPPSGRKEDRRRSRPGSDVEKPLVPARSRRRHPVTDAPLFARRGRRSFRNRSAAQDAHADQTMEIRRVVLPPAGPKAGSRRFQRRSASAWAAPPAGTGSADPHDGTGRARDRRAGPSTLSGNIGERRRVDPVRRPSLVRRRKAFGRRGGTPRRLPESQTAAGTPSHGLRRSPWTRGPPRSTARETRRPDEVGRSAAREGCCGLAEPVTLSEHTAPRNPPHRASHAPNRPTTPGAEAHTRRQESPPEEVEPSLVWGRSASPTGPSTGFTLGTADRGCGRRRHMRW